MSYKVLVKSDCEPCATPLVADVNYSNADGTDRAFKTKVQSWEWLQSFDSLTPVSHVVYCPQCRVLYQPFEQV